MRSTGGEEKGRGKMKTMSVSSHVVVREGVDWDVPLLFAQNGFRMIRTKNNNWWSKCPRPPKLFPQFFSSSP